MKVRRGKNMSINKTYAAAEIFEDIPGDPDNVLMNLPQELMEEAGIKIGDELSISVDEENGFITIKKE